MCILCSANVWKCRWGNNAWDVNFWIQFVYCVGFGFWILVAAPKGLFPPDPEKYTGPKLKVAIIGAGLAGMSTAVELLEQGHEVLVINFSLSFSCLSLLHFVLLNTSSGAVLSWPVAPVHMNELLSTAGHLRTLERQLQDLSQCIGGCGCG